MGLNPRIRVYRYSKGQYFAQHCKWSQAFLFSVSANTMPPHAFLVFPTLCQIPRCGSCPIDDESNVIVLPPSPPLVASIPAKTTWTLLLYLTSPATGCEGGETVFYPDDVSFKKSVIEKEFVIGLETGMVLLHKHGNDCMLVSHHSTIALAKDAPNTVNVA